MGYLSDYANNVAQILQQQGNAQAQARLQQGQAWGNAFQNIGQIAAQIPHQMQQARDMEEQRKLRMAQQANIDSEIKKRDQDAQMKAQAEARNQAVLQIGAGLADLDPSAVQQAIAGVKPEYRQQVENYLAEHAKMKTQQVKSAAQLAQAVGYDPEYVSVLVAMQGPKALEAFNKQTNNGQDAKAIKALVDNYATLGEKKPDVKTREVKTVNPDGSETTRIVEDLPGQEFNSAPKPTAPKALQSVQVSVNGRPMMASFDPETGNYFKPGTKEPLAGAMPIPPQGPVGGEPLESVMGPNGPVLMPRSQAAGMRPASTRDQGRPVTSGDAQDIAGIKEGIALLGQMNFKPSDTGIAPSVGGSMPDWVTNATGFGLGAKQREGMIALVRQIIGKSLEGGVLRKEDEVKYAKILPTLSDPPEVVKTKMDNLNKTLAQKLDVRLSALEDAGYDTSKFRTAKTVDPLGIRK